MGKYLGRQILNGKLDYEAVIEKYSQFKADIDNYLKDNGYKFPDDAPEGDGNE